MFYGVWFWALRSPLQTSVRPERVIIGNGDVHAIPLGPECWGAIASLENAANQKTKQLHLYDIPVTSAGLRSVWVFPHTPRAWKNPAAVSGFAGRCGSALRAGPYA